MSEHVELVDRAHMSRRVILDIDLRALTPTQRRAAERYETLSIQDGSARDPSTQHGGRLWIPVVRIDRSVVAPIEITDTDGRQVPRVTQPEMIDLMNAGVYRLTQLALEDELRRRGDDQVLEDALHWTNQPRWLLETSIARLITDGLRKRAADDEATDEPWDRARVRNAAAHVLDRISTSDQAARLLDTIGLLAGSYIVAGGVDRNQERHRLSYDLPRLPAIQGSTINSPTRRTLRALSPYHTEFYVSYSRLLSPSLGSYHLTVSAEADVNIRESCLTVSADQSVSSVLAEDLDFIASSQDYRPDRLREGPGLIKLYEYELQKCMARLSELFRRRQRDARRLAATTPRRSSTVWYQGRPAIRSDMSSIADLASRFESDELTKLVNDGSGGDAEMTAQEVARLTRVVGSLELGSELAIDDDPRENAAHFYWRKDLPLTSPGAAVDSLRARVTLALSDDSPSLMAVVFWRVLLLLVVVWGVGAFTFDHLTWWTLTTASAPASNSGQGLQSDAIIAVILLVPGLLTARLETPSRKLLLGQLRFLALTVAYSGVGVTTLLSVAVAAEDPHDGRLRVWFTAAFALLAGLLLTATCHRVFSWYASGKMRLARLQAPAWALSWNAMNPHEHTYDAVFESLAYADERRSGRSQ